MNDLEETIIKVIKSYISYFNDKNFQAITDLYAIDATIEDPIGVPLLKGYEDIRKFYEGAVVYGVNLSLVAPVRVRDREAAFAFVAKGNTPEKKIKIDIIDTMSFDESGKITQMRAFWGDKNYHTEK